MRRTDIDRDDNDLKDLRQLLGHTKADYAALRHDRPLRPPEARPTRRRPVARYAVAAAAVLAIGLGAIATIDRIAPDGPGAAQPSRLAFTPPASLTPTIGPAVRADLRQRPTLTARMRLDVPPPPSAL